MEDQQVVQQLITYACVCIMYHIYILRNFSSQTTLNDFQWPWPKHDPSLHPWPACWQCRHAGPIGLLLPRVAVARASLEAFSPFNGWKRSVYLADRFTVNHKTLHHVALKHKNFGCQGWVLQEMIHLTWSSRSCWKLKHRETRCLIQVVSSQHFWHWAQYIGALKGCR